MPYRSLSNFILLPELFRLGLPGLSNLWLSILKQSALVSAISGGELMRAGYLAAASTGHPIFFYGIVCLVYIAITTASEALTARAGGKCGDGAAEPDWARSGAGIHRPANNTEIGPSRLNALPKDFQFIVFPSACAEPSAAVRISRSGCREECT